MIYYYFTCFSKQDAFKICTFLAPTNHKSALKQAVRRQGGRHNSRHLLHCKNN